MRPDLLPTPGEIAQIPSPHLENMARAAMTASTRSAAREILLRRERLLSAAMRRYLGMHTLVSVKFNRPRWLPKPVYRMLLRSIIVEERDPSS